MFAPPPPDKDIRVNERLLAPVTTDSSGRIASQQFNAPGGQQQQLFLPVPYLHQASSQSLSASRRTVLSEADPSTFRPPNSGWDKPIEFIFTCISYAVGLGNVWRFPYLCYKNGGGAFLFPYCIMLVLVGLPIFFLELSFGQFAALGPLTIWTINPFFKGLGYAMITVSLVIGLYYNVIIAQCVLYLFMSMRGELPWDSCGNSWNTPECIDPNHRNASESYNTTFPDVSSSGPVLRTNYTAEGYLSIVGTKTEEFYYNFVLNQSPIGIDDMGAPQWRMTLCLLLSWIVVGAGLIKGIKSLGKISYFTALFPYVMLTVLLVRGCMLPGSADGIIYYLKPDWKRLKDIIVWQEAATQIFYNLSCATGGLIAMASFNVFKNNCLRDALIVPVLNAFTSIFAGLVVFSILGFMAFTKNTTVDKVASDGPGLVFIVYPEALAKLPIGPLWSILFFIMMLTLGFGSELSLIETVLTAFQDDCHDIINTKFRQRAYRIVVCVLCFLVGLPMVCRGGIYVLQLVDFFISFLALLLICLLELLVLAWLYGFPNFTFCDDLAMMLGKQPPKFFRYMWRYVTPVVLFALFICSLALYQPPSMSVGGVKLPFPAWALSLGWMVAAFPAILIPGWMIYYHCYLGGFDLLNEHVQPMVNWGPRSKDDRIGRYAQQTEAIEAMKAIRKSASQTFTNSPSLLVEDQPGIMMSIDRPPSSVPPPVTTKDQSDEMVVSYC